MCVEVDMPKGVYNYKPRVCTKYGPLNLRKLLVLLNFQALTPHNISKLRSEDKKNRLKRNFFFLFKESSKFTMNK